MFNVPTPPAAVPPKLAAAEPPIALVPPVEDLPAVFDEPPTPASGSTTFSVVELDEQAVTKISQGVTPIVRLVIIESSRLEHTIT